MEHQRRDAEYDNSAAQHAHAERVAENAVAGEDGEVCAANVEDEPRAEGEMCDMDFYVRHGLLFERIGMCECLCVRMCLCVKKPKKQTFVRDIVEFSKLKISTI